MPVQRELFDRPREPAFQRNYLDIVGLTYCRSLLTPEEQASVLREVESRPWLNDLKRRVQHYGYKYDYKARSVNPSMYVGPLPPFALAVTDRLLKRELIEEVPDQLIINEYEAGQGITAHIDCEPCFKNTIVTVSLGWVYEMDFISVTSGEVRPTLLDLGSALILRDEARYEWMHRIRARSSDGGIPRQRRVSLTFRNVLLAAPATTKG